MSAQTFRRSMNASATAVAKARDEAFRAVEAIDERHFTPEALERCIKSLARHVVNLTDDVVAPMTAVAHAAWHLMDDSGETDQHDDNGEPIHEFLHVNFEKLDEALDALEAHGWDPHPRTEEAQQ